MGQTWVESNFMTARIWKSGPFKIPRLKCHVSKWEFLKRGLQLPLGSNNNNNKNMKTNIEFWENWMGQKWILLPCHLHQSIWYKSRLSFSNGKIPWNDGVNFKMVISCDSISWYFHIKKIHEVKRYQNLLAFDFLK